jgi:fluoroacetyl-CoA thioesterase
MTLEPGMDRTMEFTVEGRLLTDVGGTIGASVLSTPGMIGMIEANAAALAFENLEDGSATVGFEVCVKHVAAAAEGQTCTAYAKLNDRRRAQAALRRRGQGRRPHGRRRHPRAPRDPGRLGHRRPGLTPPPG